MSINFTVKFLDNLPPSNEMGYTLFKPRITPFKNSDIFLCDIHKFEKLTDAEDVKTVYKLTLNTAGISSEFRPGDTVGILPNNDKTLVDKLLFRLNIESVADKPCLLETSTLPKHLPPQSTLRQIFSNSVDIHRPAKKIFLKALLRHVHDAQEFKTLEEICSVKASREYAELISGSGGTLLGLLEAFTSCKPPVEVILKHLPALQPRAYSISSSPLLSDLLEITFFVLVHADGTKGVCTGWLENLLVKKALVPFYFRQPSAFRLPQDLSAPLILIATGTGIAPFRAFLQHIRLQPHENIKIWLFYGCRYRDKDFLYKKEIDDCLKCGVLSRVDLAFSREQSEKIYVQHYIHKYGAEFTEWVLKKGAQVLVCGDGKTMVKDVKQAIVNNLFKYGGMSEDDAQKFLNEMQNKSKFVVDTWT